MIKKTPKAGYQRYRLLIAYDGTDYFGWQNLVHRSPTVQEVLEKALSKIFNEKISVIGSGRTDAGVHAQAQQAHFDAKPDSRRTRQLFNALSRMTPASIIIRGVWEAPSDFHAIWSVEKKSYIYRIETVSPPGVFTSRYSYWLHAPLNLELLRRHTEILLGKHDFTSFRTSGSDAKTTDREILAADWKMTESDRGQKLQFKITGDGFLKQMVRNIVGTLIDLNRLNAPVERVSEILAAKDRQKALTTAPARGLSLYRVFYPRDLDIQCRKI